MRTPPRASFFSNSQVLKVSLAPAAPTWGVKLEDCCIIFIQSCQTCYLALAGWVFIAWHAFPFAAPTAAAANWKVKKKKILKMFKTNVSGATPGCLTSDYCIRYVLAPGLVKTKGNRRQYDTGALWCLLQWLQTHSLGNLKSVTSMMVE